MKFTIRKNELNEAIQHVSKSLSSRTTIPILSGILLETSETGITLTSSDTDISIQSFIPTEQDEKQIIQIEQSGSVVIPGKLFVEIIRKLPADEVEIAVSDSLQIMIRSGNSELQMIGLDPEQYPVLPQVSDEHKFSISSQLLKNMIENTIFAAATNESTPILTGVLFQLQNQSLKFVATDRHRLADCENQVNVHSDFRLNNIVISARNLSELGKLLPEQDMMIDISVAGSQALFRMDRILFFTRLLEGTYPDTSKIIPQTYETQIIVNTKMFRDAMERSYLLSREDKTNIVHLKTLESQTIQLSSAMAELGKMTETIEVESLQGGPIQISFNSKYMLDALRSIASEEVQIEFTGTMRPIILKPYSEEKLLHLILPYRTAGTPQ